MSARAGQVLLGIAFVGLVLITLLSIYVWGQAAFNLLFVIGLVGLLVAHFAAIGRWEDTRAAVDENAGRTDAIEAHLSGNEPLDYGRHADPEPPSYRAPTWPTAA